jgi:5-methyltetrahydropteroyltriglutamate--homocysteine methyltransferase
MDLLYGQLKTSVIGSFPLKHSVENIRRVLADQIEAGINFPCYGQLQDMNLMFLEPLAREGCGIEVIKGEAWVTGELKPPQGAIAMEPVELAKQYLRENPCADVDGLKVPVTGPITLASVVKVSKDHAALEYPDFIAGFSEIVARIAEEYDKAGAGIITLDEPSLGYAGWLGIEPDTIIEALNRVIKVVKKAIPSIHVCGDISGISGKLLQTNAKLLEHSFTGYPGNLRAYSKVALEKADKMIGLGCVTSLPEPQLLLDIKEGKAELSKAVETVEEVEKLILEGGKRFGLERLLIVPDCGFGGMRGYFKDDTGQQIAIRKLKNMVTAARRVREAVGIGSVGNA